MEVAFAEDCTDLEVHATGYEAEVERRIIDLDVGDIRRHPRNRVPAREKVLELCTLFEQSGQLEPVVVRPMGDAEDGLYELISGETRWLAAIELGWPTIKARLRHVDDATALWEVAGGNTGRTDLDPIQRAILMAELMTETDPCGSGGGGKSAAEVGLLFGLSEATVRSTIRLLKLPPRIQQAIATGELPERTARYLVPYAEVGGMMGAIDTALNSEFCQYWWLESGRDEEHVKAGIGQLVSQHTRPIDRAVTRDYGYQLGGKHARLFGDGKQKTLSNELRELLDVREIRINNQPVEVACNVAAYDDLQLPLIQEKLAKRKGHNNGSNGKVAGVGAKSEKEKDQQQDDRLAKVTKQTAHELLRCFFARALDEVAHSDAIEPLRTWIESTGTWPRGEWGRDPLPREEFALAAAIETMLMANPRFAAGSTKTASGGRPTDVYGLVDQACRCENDPDHGAERFRWLLVRLYLWPVSSLIPFDDPDADTEGMTCGPVLLGKETLPDAIAVLNHEDTVKYAGLLKLRIDGAWLEASVDGQCRMIVERWLRAHTRKQLGRQAKEWGLGFSEHAKVSESVDDLLASHRVKGIRLPACFGGKKK